MSGHAKRAYDKDMQLLRKDITLKIKTIINVLPKSYTSATILCLFDKYYPFDWQYLEERYNYYELKDRRLAKLKKKRYYMKKTRSFILSLPVVLKILKPESKQQHFDNYNHSNRTIEKTRLNNKLIPKINKILEKRKIARGKAQAIEPFYLDQLMGLYDKKRTSQKDKVYIFKELEKYYCKKTINFFKKLNDKEINHQLREMSFYHLQSLGHFVKLRRRKSIPINTQKRKRKKFLKDIYSKQRFNIESIPNELEYRIQNNKEQKIKSYDYFISHSSKDFNFVQNLIKKLNEKNFNVYCDWVNDTDYLKRNLVGDATKRVIELRMNQANKLILVKSNNSLNSSWVKYELNYFHELNKPIYEVDVDAVNQDLVPKLSKGFWFEDKNYKNLKLY